MTLPVDPERMRKMEMLAREIGGIIGGACTQIPGCGFTLFLFGYGTGELTYISSSNREDMVKTLMEFIAANPPAMLWDEQHG